MSKKDPRSFGSLQRCYDLFSCKDALCVAAGLGALKSFPILVLVASCLLNTWEVSATVVNRLCAVGWILNLGTAFCGQNQVSSYKGIFLWYLFFRGTETPFAVKGNV